MGTKGQGTLFLMEFIVKRIDFVKNAFKNRPECKIGKLVVFVKFLQFPIEIEEETKGKLMGKGEFKKGRSCLFAITSLPPPSALDAEFYVVRKRPDGVIPDKVTLGRTKLNFSCHFTNVMKLSLSRPKELPICKAIQDTLELSDVKDVHKPIGTLTIILRATCLGKLVVTQLRKFGENSVLVKGAKDDSLYECESIVRKKRSSGLLQDKPKIKKEDMEKGLDEEFKEIVGNKKSISEDSHMSMMKPCPPKCSSASLNDLEFTTFCDESNRICVMYQQDDQCVPDPICRPVHLGSTCRVPEHGDGRGVRGARMIRSQLLNSPNQFQPPPILRQHSAPSREDLRTRSMSNTAIPGPSTSQGRRRACKDCARKKDQDFDFCPVYPGDAALDHEPTYNERLGIKVCEGPCLPPPPGPPPKKEEKEEPPLERIPRTSSAGRALVLARAKAADQKIDSRKPPKAKRQPVKVLAPSKRPWEPNPNAPPEETEPPENTAHFPPTQPYNTNTDIEIRTPVEPGANVFLMKMLGKTNPKPVLQLELRTPRKPLPGELEQKPPEEEPPPPAEKKKKGKKGKKGGKGKKGKKGGKGKKGKKGKKKK